MNKKITELDFEAGDSKEYEVETICDSAVYAMKSESGHLPRLHYLVTWKGYSEKENIWEPVSMVQHLRKLISSFHKDHPEKPTVTSLPVDSALPIARPTDKPTAKCTTKRKRGQSANSANKQAKKNWTFCLFPHVTSPWPNQVTCLLGFH